MKASVEFEGAHPSMRIAMLDDGGFDLHIGQACARVPGHVVEHFTGPSAQGGMMTFVRSADLRELWDAATGAVCWLPEPHRQLPDALTRLREALTRFKQLNVNPEELGG